MLESIKKPFNSGKITRVLIFISPYLQDLFSAGRFVLDFKESFWKQRALFFEKVSLLHQILRALGQGQCSLCCHWLVQQSVIFINEYLWNFSFVGKLPFLCVSEVWFLLHMVLRFYQFQFGHCDQKQWDDFVHHKGSCPFSLWIW